MVCATRAVCDSPWSQTVDLATSSCSISQILHNDAVKPTVRHHSDSQTARLAHAMRTPVLVFAWCV
eukprot:4919294-Lingulodinium_polyedra.AAC.1